MDQVQRNSMIELYPAEFAEIEAIQSAQQEEPKIKIQWGILPVAQTSQAEQAGKIRKLEAGTLATLALTFSGGAIYTAMAVTAPPLALIGGFGALTTMALASSGGVAYLFVNRTKEEIEYEGIIKERKELESHIKTSGLPTVSDLRSYVERKTLSEDEFQQLLSNEIAHQPFNALMQKHGLSLYDEANEVNRALLSCVFEAYCLNSDFGLYDIAKEPLVSKSEFVITEDFKKQIVKSNLRSLARGEMRYVELLARNPLKEVIKYAFNDSLDYGLQEAFLNQSIHDLITRRMDFQVLGLNANQFNIYLSDRLRKANLASILSSKGCDQPFCNEYSSLLKEMALEELSGKSLFEGVSLYPKCFTLNLVDCKDHFSNGESVETRIGKELKERDISTLSAMFEQVPMLLIVSCLKNMPEFERALNRHVIDNGQAYLMNVFTGPCEAVHSILISSQLIHEDLSQTLVHFQKQYALLKKAYKQSLIAKEKEHKVAQYMHEKDYSSKYELAFAPLKAAKTKIQSCQDEVLAISNLIQLEQENLSTIKSRLTNLYEEKKTLEEKLKIKTGFLKTLENRRFSSSIYQLLKAEIKALEDSVREGKHQERTDQLTQKKLILQKVDEDITEEKELQRECTEHKRKITLQQQEIRQTEEEAKRIESELLKLPSSLKEAIKQLKNHQAWVANEEHIQQRLLIEYKNEQTHKLKAEFDSCCSQLLHQFNQEVEILKRALIAQLDA